jgi:hypothetical protein
MVLSVTGKHLPKTRLLAPVRDFSEHFQEMVALLYVNLSYSRRKALSKIWSAPGP